MLGRSADSQLIFAGYALQEAQARGDTEAAQIATDAINEVLRYQEGVPNPAPDAGYHVHGSNKG